MGAANPNGLPLNLFSTGEARWLEVQIAGQQAEPRALIASVPYALKAADAATLGGFPPSAFALAGNTGGFINPSTITPEANSTVTTTGGTSNKVAKFSGTSVIANSILYDNGTQVGVGTTTPTATLTVNGTLAVNGNSTLNGAEILNPTAAATSSAGKNSEQLKMYASAYNSSSKAAVTPHFIWQVEPTGNNTSSPGGTLNLLASPNSGSSSETGLYLNTNGTIHFASGQTFPGGGSGSGTITGVTAGTGLTGGGTSGNVTLKVNTAAVPVLSGNNSFTGTDTFTASINANNGVNIDSTDSNPGSLSPGLRFGHASGEGISSQRTYTNNPYPLYGLDFYTDSQLRMSINHTGEMSVGPSDGSDPAFPTLSIDDTSGSDANVLSAFGQGSECDIDVNANLSCSGNLSGATKNFKIDDPLDPANKYLVHSSVESSEMLNIYSGNVTTDGSGSATVTLPAWFASENGDFRYQLTTIGQDARAWIIARGLERTIQDRDQCHQCESLLADHCNAPG